jgi:predicted aldo/keto reductase-like oxidoreductase
LRKRHDDIVADPDRAAELLSLAAERGINLVWAGNDAARARGIAGMIARANLGTAVSRVIEFAGATAEALTAFLAEAGRTERDILLVRASDAKEASALERAGVFRAAERARSGSVVAHAGFSAPADEATILACLEAFPGADLWASEYGYPDFGIAAAIGAAAARELSFISLDPFAGGALERVPPAVHEAFRDASVPRSHDEWALRGVWESQDLVSAVVYPESGEDLARKAILAEAGRANSLPSKELAVLAEAAAIFKTGRKR